MLDTRYHIIYLCAIFLMLGFGILIGESFLGPLQIRQNTRTLADLRVKVDGALQDASTAKDQLTKVYGAMDGLRPALVRNKLAGMHVVLVQTGTGGETLSAAKESLVDAGADASTVVVSSRLYDLAPDQVANVCAEAGGAATAAAPQNQDPTLIMKYLARAIAQGTTRGTANATALKALQHHDIITLTGDLSRAAQGVVVVGGQDESGHPADEQAETEQSLVAALKGLTSAHLAECEALSCATSSVPTFQQLDIPTVDCIDVPVGKLDLPFALLGGVDSDDYGLRSTAHRQIPVSLASGGNGL